MLANPLSFLSVSISFSKSLVKHGCISLCESRGYRHSEQKVRFIAVSTSLYPFYIPLLCAALHNNNMPIKSLRSLYEHPTKVTFS